MRAAWLWAGGCVAGPAAAWWHGMLERAPPVVGLARPTARASRPGVRVRQRLLDDRDRILRAADLTGWVLHLPFAGWEIDVAFPAARVARAA